MTELLTAAQMRAIEQAAIASGEVTGLELMERAGRGVVEAILEWRPELAETSHRAVVLCGPGNNGGDGFVVARLLKQRGWEVEVFFYGDEARLPPDAAENARRWREMGEVEPASDINSRFQTCEIFIDALFGTGLKRPLAEELEAIWDAHLLANTQADYMTISVDMASGICSDSGREVGDASFVPSLTVTFHRPKLGHYVGKDGIRCDVVTKSIGLNENVLDQGPVKLVDIAISSDFLDLCKVDEHKYESGHALVLTGGIGSGGAARLSARGALRIGAGLVTVGCPPDAVGVNAARLDAIMLAPVNDASSMLKEMRRRKVNSVCLGPGFGLGERLRNFVTALLIDESQGENSDQPVRPVGTTGQRPTAPTGGRFASARGRSLPSEQRTAFAEVEVKQAADARLKPGLRPVLNVVLDADALTEYRDDPETLFAMLHDGCVLTPHEGEFGRLFPDILAKLKEPATKGPAYSKVDATREAAKRAGCVVLFKGPDTVIAHPNGRCSINSALYERAAPWLATAGSGDVLAGFITGLLARGFDPMNAAETAAWLHVECARKFGPGLIAEDLPEQLPAVFRDLGIK